MMDCAKEMLGFHDDEVTLPEPERRDMRERRNANRNRLKNGLKKDGKPGPQEFVTQGSYAMRTIEFIPIKPSAATGSDGPGSYAGHSRVPSRDRGRRPSTAGCGPSRRGSA